MTMKTKRKFPIKSELGSPAERDAKIAEMAKRGFTVKRKYEYTKERSDYVARLATMQRSIGITGVRVVRFMG